MATAIHSTPEVSEYIASVDAFGEAQRKIIEYFSREKSFFDFRTYGIQLKEGGVVKGNLTFALRVDGTSVFASRKPNNVIIVKEAAIVNNPSEKEDFNNYFDFAKGDEWKVGNYRLKFQVSYYTAKGSLTKLTDGFKEYIRIFATKVEDQIKSVAPDRWKEKTKLIRKYGALSVGVTAISYLAKRVLISRLPCRERCICKTINVGLNIILAGAGLVGLLAAATPASLEFNIYKNSFMLQPK